MHPKYHSFSLLIILLLLHQQTLCMQNHKQQQYPQLQYINVINNNNNDECKYPLMIQYINSYTLPANNLLDLIYTSLNQSLHLKDISNTNQNVVFHDIYVKFVYSGTNSKNITKISDTQIIVTNDSLTLSVTFIADIAKNIGKNTYNITIKTQDVLIGYTKKYTNNQFIISNVTVQYLQQWLSKGVTIVPDPKKADDLTKITKIIQNQLQISLKKQVSTVRQLMTDSATSAKIGDIYPQGIYQYSFYGFNSNMDMSSLQIRTQKLDDGKLLFINDIKGTINKLINSQCPAQKKVNRMDKYDQFISVEFIQNMASTENIKAYRNWQALQVNHTWVRTISFQWRLIDLQFVAPQILQKHPQNYLDRIAFTCQLITIDGIQLNNNSKSVDTTVNWRCNGHFLTSQSFQGQQQQQTVFMNMDLKIKHKIQLRLSNSGKQTYILAYVNQLQLLNIQITIPDVQQQQMIAIDINLAEVYITQTFNDMRRYVIGTYFKVASNSQQIIFDIGSDDGDGIWIG